MERGYVDHDGKCELGVHIHAWNNPPYYRLPLHDKSSQPFLIEYPREIMEEKIAAITKEFRKKLGFTPKMHRAGRWAISDAYLHLLKRYGYQIDCSVVPYVD